MPYRSVSDRCFVDFSEFDLKISIDQAIKILEDVGFTKVEVDLVELALEKVDVSQYRRGARLYEAPKVFDCSSLIKWLYTQKGIWLPRRSIQQREFGTPVNINDICPGDIVFVSGYINYYISDPNDGVGHVGIATSNKTIVHAANSKLGVIESSLDSFVGPNKLRGIKRIIPNNHQTYTFITPFEREIEWSNDAYWIILQNLK